LPVKALSQISGCPGLAGGRVEYRTRVGMVPAQCSVVLGSSVSGPPPGELDRLTAG